MKKAVFLLVSVLIITYLSGYPSRAELVDEIPAKVLAGAEAGGTVGRISYPTRDYAGDGSPLIKEALVYLPPAYPEGGPFDVLFLLHGLGGDETEWGFDADSDAKKIVDSLIVSGRTPRMIIVMPNGRSRAEFTDFSSKSVPSFHLFGQELRNDLVPCIDANYMTWGSLTPDDPAASRTHRAIAGLSMGAMQVINIGLCECPDLFSAFGAFSAPKATWPAERIASELERFPDLPIRCLYCVCGTSDTSAFASSQNAVKRLPDLCERFTQSNLYWHETPGGHNFRVWNLGFYQFLLLLGRTDQNR